MVATIPLHIFSFFPSILIDVCRHHPSDHYDQLMMAVFMQGSRQPLLLSRSRSRQPRCAPPQSSCSLLARTRRCSPDKRLTSRARRRAASKPPHRTLPKLLRALRMLATRTRRQHASALRTSSVARLRTACRASAQTRPASSFKAAKSSMVRLALLSQTLQRPARAKCLHLQPRRIPEMLCVCRALPSLRSSWLVPPFFKHVVE